MDLVSFWSIKLPRSVDDMHDLEYIHVWITAAFVGLSRSSMSLIYMRTRFYMALFLPKLWLKTEVMRVNSGIHVIMILPMMRRMLGRCL